MTQAATRALKLMKDFASSRIKLGQFDSAVLSKSQIISGSEGHVICEIPVSTELLNGAGTLHGGAAATIVDSVSTWAVVSQGKNIPGVSVDLSMTYMKAAFPGDTLVVEARTSHMGGRLAFLTVDITNKDTGILLAQGKHTKYLSMPKTKTPPEKC